MTSPAVPFIECEQIHAGLAVSDIPTAVEFYIEKLGFKEAFRWGEPPTFAGVNLGKVQMFLAKGTRSISLSATPTSCTNSTAPMVSKSHRQSMTDHMASGTIPCATCMGIILRLDITCSTVARRAKLSGLTCRCVWRNVWRHFSTICQTQADECRRLP